jgi:uncharacterized protein (TIGR00251 family)
MAEEPEWARWQQDGLRLRFHAQPGAKRTVIGGEHGGRLRVALHAPPVDGKANEELLRHLAARLGLKKSAVELVAGLTSREKSVLVQCNQAEARVLVALLAPEPPNRPSPAPREKGRG